jgi:hypothetical protein
MTRKKQYHSIPDLAMQLPTEYAIIFYAIKGYPPRSIECLLVGVSSERIRSAMSRGRKRGERIPRYAGCGLATHQLQPN